MDEEKNEETKVTPKQFGMFGTYDDIKIKGGQIKFTVAVDLNENISHLADLADRAGEPVQIGMQFRQTELEV